jgi:TRAP-type mannitol/chloroaromatic compound transport system permease small subunit
MTFSKVPQLLNILNKLNFVLNFFCLLIFLMWSKSAKQYLLYQETCTKPQL